MPGPAGPHVVITMEAVPGPVCVGHEPVITPRPSVVASSAMASVWRSPTAPGTFFGDTPAHIFCLCQRSINVYEPVSIKKGDGEVQYRGR